MKPLIICSFLLLTYSLSAQNDNWAYFSPSPLVSCLAASGNAILAGTSGAGILRLDTLGNRTFYNTGNSAIPVDSINQIAIDAAGQWWIHHREGISMFNGANWQTWSLSQIGLPANTLIRTIKSAPDNSIYVPTDKGVAIFKNSSWSVINNANSGLPSDVVWDVAFNPDGKVYFATTTSGLVIQDGSTWTSYTSANTGISLMTNVYAVAYTVDGVLWVLGGTIPTVPVRLAKFEAGIWTGYSTVNIGITAGGPVREITAAADGALWLTTSYTVSVLANDIWTHYFRETDIGCSSIGSVAPVIAGNGHVWIQSSCQLAEFDGQNWNKPGTNIPGPAPGVFYDGIAEDKEGGMWMGTEFGEFIAHYKDDTWKHYYPTAFGAFANDVYSIQTAADGAVWFGLGNAEILKFENNNWSFYDTCRSVFTDHIVLNSATAPNGDQWFSFFSTGVNLTSGLARHASDGAWQFFPSSEIPALNYTYLRKIAFDANGVLWCATTHKGILKYDGVSWDTITVNNAALPSNRVFDLAFAPDGKLWACTILGLAVFDGQTWTTINTANSDLPSNKTFRIAFDKVGGMYVGYGRQVSGSPGTTVALLRDGVWTELTPPGWEITVNEEPDAFIVDSQNRLWFAELTGPGVYRYDPVLANSTTTIDEASIQMILSPNPCPGDGVLQLENETQPGMQLRVSNMLGQTVMEVPEMPAGSTSIPVNVRSLQPGIYWMTLWQGNKLQGRKGFVKI